MSFLPFVIVALAAILLAFLWELIFRVYPAYRAASIEKSLYLLTRCATRLNQSALPEGKIRDGHYLHDRFYKLVFHILTNKINLRFRILKHIDEYPSSSEEARSVLRAEINALDENTREIIDKAIYAMSKILLLRNPVVYTLFCLKIRQKERVFQVQKARRDLRDRMMKSAEYLTVSARDDDCVFVPC